MAVRYVRSSALHAIEHFLIDRSQLLRRHCGSMDRCGLPMAVSNPGGTLIEEHPKWDWSFESDCTKG